MDEDITYYDSTKEKGFLEKLKLHLIDFIQTLVVFGAIFALIFWQIAQPHKVSGNSMLPTLHDGEYILTDKVSYKIGQPKYGEIIVFKNPRDQSQDFVKRIIGIPSDIIQITNNKVLVNSQPVNEYYLSSQTKTEARNFSKEGGSYQIGEEQYYVLGDNREHSSDSREWGTITKAEIIGKVFFRYWPIQNFGLVKSLP